MNSFVSSLPFFLLRTSLIRLLWKKKNVCWKFSLIRFFGFLLASFIPMQTYHKMRKRRKTKKCTIYIVNESSGPFILVHEMLFLLSRYFSLLVFPIQLHCFALTFTQRFLFVFFLGFFLKKIMIISVTLLDIWHRHGSSFFVAELCDMNEMRIKLENIAFSRKKEKRSVKKGKFTSAMPSVECNHARESEMKTRRETYCWQISHIWKYMWICVAGFIACGQLPSFLNQSFFFSHFSIFFTVFHLNLRYYDILAEIPRTSFWTTFIFFQLLNRVLCTNVKLN